MSDYIPQEVLIDILLRLPVKSLLSFRSVSKSWRNLISAPDFISMQTHFATAPKSSSAAPILLRHYSLLKNKELFSLHRLLDDDMSIKHCHELECPFISCGVYFRIVGSCNGLLCLSNTNSVILWNPAIRRSVTCSVPEFTVPSEYKSVYGFGFDPVTDDYKVVRVVYGLGVFPQVQVFELGTRDWRGIGAASPPYSVSTHCSQAFVNGAVHWVGYNPDEADDGSRRFVVVSFHMSQETLEEIEFPDSVSIECLQDFAVVVSGEDLTLVQHMRSRQSVAYFDSCCIWVMSEYGDSRSWVRKFNVDLGFWDGIGVTLGFCKNDHILLATGVGELILYDLESQSISFVGIHGPVCSFFMDTYVESLVLLD